MGNLNLALEVAEKHLDIPKMLDAEGTKITLLCSPGFMLFTSLQIFDLTWPVDVHTLSKQIQIELNNLYFTFQLPPMSQFHQYLLLSCFVN